MITSKQTPLLFCFVLRFRFFSNLATVRRIGGLTQASQQLYNVLHRQVHQAAPRNSAFSLFIDFAIQIEMNKNDARARLRDEYNKRRKHNKEAATMLAVAEEITAEAAKKLLRRQRKQQKLEELTLEQRLRYFEDQQER